MKRLQIGLNQLVTGDDAIIEENENDNQQLLSDEVEMKDPSLAEILADSMNEEILRLQMKNCQQHQQRIMIVF